MTRIVSLDFDLPRVLIVSFTLGAFASMTGCEDKRIASMKNNPNSEASTQAVEWQKLSGKIILFQHESVGKNILDGVGDIKRDDSKINIAIADDVKTDVPSGALLIDSRLGRNGDAIAKIDHFKQVLENGLGEKTDVAMMKLCYVDITPTSDLRAIINHYKSTLTYLKGKYPNTTFVHLTVPVKVRGDTWRTRVKEFLGKDSVWEYEENIARGNYNDLLKKEYLGKEPVLDIAAIESARADGTKEVFTHKGVQYEALAPEYTTDGGHLNELGRKRVAFQLLRFLSDLPVHQQ